MPTATFSTTSIEPTPAPTAVSVADIIQIAKRQLDAQPPSRELKLLKTELAGIPASSGQFAEAQKLLAGLDSRIKNAEKEEAKAKSNGYEKEERERIESEESGLKASVRFTGTQFAISNAGTFAWRDTKLEVNGTFSLLGSGKGYRVTVGDVAPGTTLKIGVMQFANSDGERFNPLIRKASSFSITAHTPHTTGSWSGEF
jgi:hypothetical protein